MDKLPETIFIDRDGVINEDSDAFIKSLKEWQTIPGSIEAIADLSKAGITIIIITNQSGLARSLLTLKDLQEIHQKLIDDVKSQGGKITDIFFCPHGPNDHCDCRKPKPGLLLQAQKKYHLNLNKSYLIGDSYRDLEAGLAAGTKVALTQTGKGETTLLNHPELIKTTAIFKNLKAFSTWILKDTQ